MIDIQTDAAGRTVTKSTFQSDFTKRFGAVSARKLTREIIPVLRREPYWLSSYLDIQQNPKMQGTFKLKDLGLAPVTGYVYDRRGRFFEYRKPEQVHALEVRTLTARERILPIAGKTLTALASSAATAAVATFMYGFASVMPTLMEQYGTVAAGIDAGAIAGLGMLGIGVGLRAKSNIAEAFRCAATSKLGIALRVEEDMAIPNQNLPAFLNTAIALKY